MEVGLGDPAASPHCPQPRWQPILWPTLAAIALLSSLTEASLDQMSPSLATRDGPSPVLAPPTDHLPGGRAAHLCSERTLPPPPQSPQPAPPPPGPGFQSPPAALRGARAARAGTRSSRARATDERGCRLRSQLVPVSALGLGHSSDELVRFRFCSGSCRRARSPTTSAWPACWAPGPCGRPRVPADQPTLLPAHSL